MDYFEALDLRSFLLITCAASRIALHQLGNREWVLRTTADGGAWFIWDYRDARAFCQALEDKGRAQDVKRKNRERVTA